MKICAIILLLVTVTVAEPPYLRCSYSLNRNTYQCDLTINNPNGLNNFTQIEGVHLNEFTNSDVVELCVVSDASVSTNVPSIVCDTFPNLVRIDLSNIGLTEISDGDFVSCSRIIRLILGMNNINSISANAFIRLPQIDFIDLIRNTLTTLPETVFINQKKLTWLRLSENPLNDIPVGLLRPLEKLEQFFISSIKIRKIKTQWFHNTHLQVFFVSFNGITALPDSFIGLEELKGLLIDSNEISEIQSGGFTGLTNLESLYLNGNKLTALQADTFLGLGKLIYLSAGNNPIESINEKAFRGLDSLTSLSLESCRIRQIQTNYFENLPKLTSIALSHNEIEELPEGVFGELQLESISVSSNRLNTLRRNSFGSLRNLDWFDVNFNMVNAVDRAIIDDANHLEKFFLYQNLCANFVSRDFVANRTQLLPMLQECFDNYDHIIVTTTERNEATTESNEEIQSTVYQIFQNDRYKVDFGFKLKYIYLFYSVLSFTALFAVSSIIYLLTKRSNQMYLVNQ